MAFMKFSRLILKAKLFGGVEVESDITFDDGCTVIITNSNTQGKSSLINALAVGLGFDDLVKSNITALVNSSAKYQGVEHKILSGYIGLEIKNEDGQVLSIKREVQPELSKGLLVRFERLNFWKDEDAEEYYVGKNSYIGDKGFHRLLGKFIGFPEVDVISQNDGLVKLYMEYVFAAIFVEQKRGWADIMANSPYFQVREPKKTTISEILGMNYIQDSLQKNTLKLEVARLKSLYEESLDAFKLYINGKHFSLKNIPSDMFAETWNPQIVRAFNDQEKSLDFLISDREEKLSNLTIAEDENFHSSEFRDRISGIANEITSLNSRKMEIDNAISILDAAIYRYIQRMTVLEDDLRKNLEEQKIKKIFNRDGWSLKSQCPVCEQSIDESLLSQVKSFPTMSIDENVKYIKDQRDLLKEVILIEVDQRKKCEEERDLISSEIDSLMQMHSEIQKSLSGVIPSNLMAKAREIAYLEQEIKNFNELNFYSINALAKIKRTLDGFIIENEKLNLLGSDISENDLKILEKFQSSFKNYLRRLGYNSYEINSIIIDKNSFGPRVIVSSMDQKRHMRADFGSSASDWIRIITAYTLALHVCRNNSEKSVHPNISIFDEPAQQNIDKEDHLKFYDLVNDVCNQGGQIIIAETDKDKSVRRKAKSLGMKIVDFGDDYVLSGSKLRLDIE